VTNKTKQKKKTYSSSSPFFPRKTQAFYGSLASTDWMCDDCYDLWQSGNNRHNKTYSQKQSTEKQRKETSKMKEKQPTKKAKVDSSKEKNGCSICHSNKATSQTILCSTCDQEFHAGCLVPRLETIPSGKWNCPACRKQKET
jgi:hypothetical protein